MKPKTLRTRCLPCLDARCPGRSSGISLSPPWTPFWLAAKRRRRPRRHRMRRMRSQRQRPRPLTSLQGPRRRRRPEHLRSSSRSAGSSSFRRPGAQQTQLGRLLLARAAMLSLSSSIFRRSQGGVGQPRGPSPGFWGPLFLSCCSSGPGSSEFCRQLQRGAPEFRSSPLLCPNSSEKMAPCCSRTSLPSPVLRCHRLPPVPGRSQRSCPW
mmetsp:Transcript_37167/g.59863  ORF Transcript_37167/g.59863 Transcript_37167/m.59863 type:complete len:210 (+) Transcript_37167:576-1205(+)